jgi:acyl-CoA thioester hydrolase
MTYFSIHHHVVFFETDAMGVVHHSNYFRFFEEARGAWVRENDLTNDLYGSRKIGFAVIHAEANFRKPARHGDEIVTRLQVRRDGIRYHFQYAVLNAKTNDILVTGKTVHVPLNEEMKPCKVPGHFNEKVESSPWTETWP